MTNIPPQFKELASSAELYDQSQIVGNKFGLMIDQIGELDAEIRDVLDGASNPADFSKHIAERLEVSREVADAITKEVNQTIFEAIKAKVMADTAKAEADKAKKSVEQAGGFSIEHENHDKVKNNSFDTPVEEGDRARILSHIEDHTDPLVDHLLSSPQSKPADIPRTVTPAQPQPAQTPQFQQPAQPAPIPQEPLAPEPPKTRPTAPDPYREPTE